MDSAHEQEFRVRDLSTRSVTLFPTQAQVIRDIKGVVLKPGANQITVVGFTPYTDSSSFKVEGTGSAVISDMTVELVHNNELFEDVYPESDDDDSESTTDDGSDSDSAPETSSELKELRRTLADTQDEEKAAQELIASAEKRTNYLDAYGKMLDRKRGIDIDVGIEKYRSERAKTFQDKTDGKKRLRELQPILEKLSAEESRLLKRQKKEEEKARRAKDKARRAREKEWRIKAARKQEKIEKKDRIQNERKSLWPLRCYTVHITLDVGDYTPSTSRRTSVSSLTELAKPVVEQEEEMHDIETPAFADHTCDISISYVTKAAFWAPTYDLQLSTTKNTAVLCFDAVLTNRTSETWKNCKVVLSTSQTTFSGINDVIPTLTPWRIKLAENGGNGLETLEKSQQESGYKAETAARPPRSKTMATMLPTTQAMLQGSVEDQMMQKLMQEQQQKQAQEQMQQHRPHRTLQVARTSGFRPASKTLATPMAVSAPRAPPTVMHRFGASAAGGLFGTSTSVPESAPEHVPAPAPALETVSEVEPAPGLEFQESVYEESGLTATYDLPGLKTLTPRLVTSKQRIARASFSSPGSVAFSHSIVAKLRPVAFLRTKIKNTSKLTLLRGTAGLTLDGSFIGRTNMPRCSVGDYFYLNLGVDPAISVVYPPPTIKRTSSTGIFSSKENSCSYLRHINITNTHPTAHSKAIHLLAIDQVPVSEDEKLRVDLEQPQGLTLNSKAVASGVAVTAPGGADVTAATKGWGTATATMKKAGEIVWEVDLNPGWTVRLDLQYSIGAPAGEGVAQC